MVIKIAWIARCGGSCFIPRTRELNDKPFLALRARASGFCVSVYCSIFKSPALWMTCYIFVCGSNRSVHMCGHMWRAEVGIGIPFSLTLCTPASHRISHWTWISLSRLEWMAREPSRSTCLYFPCTGMEAWTIQAYLCSHGFWGVNLDLYACMIKHFTAESSLWPCSLSCHGRQFIIWRLCYFIHAEEHAFRLLEGPFIVGYKGSLSLLSIKWSERTPMDCWSSVALLLVPNTGFPLARRHGPYV